jgi:chromosome segregation ATPase
MKKLLIVVLVLLVGVAALGYWRGWFSVTKGGNTDVRADPAKFEQDKEAFSKSVGEKAKALKHRIAGLWTKAEGLTGDGKAQAKKELAELEKKHERLEKQLGELEGADAAKFESLEQDLSKTLAEVDKKIDELTRKLAKGNGE